MNEHGLEFWSFTFQWVLKTIGGLAIIGTMTYIGFWVIESIAKCGSTLIC